MEDELRRLGIIVSQAKQEATLRESMENSERPVDSGLRIIKISLDDAFDTEHVRGFVKGLDAAFLFLRGVRSNIGCNLPSGKEFLIKEPKGRERIEGRTVNIGWDRETGQIISDLESLSDVK